MTKRSTLGRRQFFAFTTTTVALAASASLFPKPALAGRAADRIKSLSMVNLHSGESAKITFWENGQYDPAALSTINTFLRDTRTGQVHQIDTRLLDLLVSLRSRLNTTAAYQVISAYRSAETNEELAAHSRGVAKHSYHIEGMAIDVRLPGRGLRQVRDTALRMAAGGVGYYPRSNFVHVDVGPVRHW